MASYIRKIWRNFNYYRLRKAQIKQLSRLRHYGVNVYISKGVQFACPSNISIGDHVWIGPNSKFDGRGGVEIASGCLIARDVEVLSSNHYFKGDDLMEIPFDTRFICEPVHICENAMVGLRTIILPGVTIGEGANIGAGSVVTKDVPPLAMAAGNPARVIRYRDQEQYYRLKKAGKIYIKENHNYDVSPDRLK